MLIEGTLHVIPSRYTAFREKNIMQLGGGGTLDSL